MKINYLAKYSKANNGVKMFQAGGPAPAPGPEGGAGMESGGAPPEGAAGPEAGGGGEGDLQAAIMQVVQTQDPQMALQVVNMIAQAMGIAPQGAAGPPQQGMGGQMNYGGGGYISPSYGFQQGNQGVVGGMPAGSDFVKGANHGKVGAGSGTEESGAGNQGKVGGYGKVMGAHGMKIPVFSASLINNKKKK